MSFHQLAVEATGVLLLKIGFLCYSCASGNLWLFFWFHGCVVCFHFATLQKNCKPTLIRMQFFNPLPDDQLLRSESSLPKFIRRIKQQLDLYELSEYAGINDELPYASLADMSKRLQASALIKQSITDEVLNQFPEDFTGRQIIRVLAIRDQTNSPNIQYESKDSRNPMGTVGGNFTVAEKGFIESFTSRYESEYEMPVLRRPDVMRTLHPILPHQVAYVEASRARRNSGVDSRDIQGSALRDMKHSGSISQCSSPDMTGSGSISDGSSTSKFNCNVCQKQYQGKRQLARHLIKHNEPNKFRCSVEV
jgi:hypothetical protein